MRSVSASWARIPPPSTSSAQPGSRRLEQLELLDRRELAAALGLESLAAAARGVDVASGLTGPEPQPERRPAAVTGAVEDVLQGSGCVIATLPNDDPGNVACAER